MVLNLASGVYGKGFGYWSARYHKEMVEIEVPYNEAIDPAQVAEAFRKRPDIKVVSLVHHDTPSGTINPAREIGKIVREHDALLIVDAVSSFGGMDIHPDDCFADIFITGPGKCLGGAPGLTLMAVSDRAWKHIEANPKAPLRLGPQPQGLEGRLEQGQAVPLHALGGGDERPRRARSTTIWTRGRRTSGAAMP